jgi:hypothetical protein
LFTSFFVITFFLKEPKTTFCFTHTCEIDCVYSCVLKVA